MSWVGLRTNPSAASPKQGVCRRPARAKQALGASNAPTASTLPYRLLQVPTCRRQSGHSRRVEESPPAGIELSRHHPARRDRSRAPRSITRAEIDPATDGLCRRALGHAGLLRSRVGTPMCPHTIVLCPCAPTYTYRPNMAVGHAGASFPSRRSSWVCRRAHCGHAGVFQRCVGTLMRRHGGVAQNESNLRMEGYSEDGSFPGCTGHHGRNPSSNCIPQDLSMATCWNARIILGRGHSRERSAIVSSAIVSSAIVSSAENGVFGYADIPASTVQHGGARRTASLRSVYCMASLQNDPHVPAYEKGVSQA